MRRPLIGFALLAGVLVAPPAARATADSPDHIRSIADSSSTYAKYKGWQAKAVKRRGPPPWAPAHGLRRKYRR